MFKEKEMLFLFTETPLHAGSGSNLGVVDLPIQRETHTNYPIIQFSGIKGAIRELAEERMGLWEVRKNKDVLANKEKTEKERLKREEEEILKFIEIAFGPETERADKHGGALSFTDARVVLFPVRSLKGVFAWITSPDALSYLKRDLEILGKALEWEAEDVPPSDTAYVSNGSDLTIGKERQKIILEECAFNAVSNENVDKIAKWLKDNAFLESYKYWKDKLCKEEGSVMSSNLVILPNDAYRDFLTFSTEVVQRIRITHETGTVARGALWTEEYLPKDTLLYTMVTSTDPKGGNPPDKLKDAKGIINFLNNKVLDTQLLQLGGDKTGTRGLVRVRIYGG